MEAKVALVTGSSSGIGEATVKLLAEKGYRVVVTGSRKEKVDRVVAECAKLSPQKLQVSLPPAKEPLSSLVAQGGLGRLSWSPAPPLRLQFRHAYYLRRLYASRKTQHTI